MTVIATGAEEVGRYQMIVIRRAIMMYRDTGMKANRAYTPKNMKLMAEKITGKKFKARDYDGMIAALTEKLGCDHDWQPGVIDLNGEVVLAEPAYDLCINCGERRD